MDRPIKNFIIEVAAFALLFNAVAIFVALRTNNDIKEFEELKACCTETTTGKITDVKESWRLTPSKIRRKYYIYYNYYSYTVGDKTYEGDSVTLKDTRDTLGDPIEVHYDPYEPGVNYTYMDKPTKDHGDVAEKIGLCTLGIIIGILLICWAGGLLKIFVRKDEPQLLEEYEEVISEDNTDDSDV